MALRPPVSFWQYRGNRLATAPASEPITLTELKTALRITDTNEDTYLTDLITEARQEIEDATGIAFISQAWVLTLDHWPPVSEQWWDGVRDGHINTVYEAGSALARTMRSVELPRYPLITVDTVTVYDEASNATAVTIADTFNIDITFLRGRMTLQSGATWPVALRANDAISIAYTAGYGADATTVPAPLKRAVRNMAAYMYEHRGDCNTEDAFMKSGAKAILNRYRDVSL